MFHLSLEQSFLLFFYSSLFGYVAASLSPIRFKVWILSLSASLHLTSYVIRSFQVERLPLVGVFDTLSLLSLLVVLLALVFFRIYRSLTFLEGGAVFGAFLLLVDLFAPRTLHPLPPVLKTLWFEVHVALSFVAYAFFAIGLLSGVDYFLSRRDETSLHAGYNANLWGYLFFSIAMIAGGIWAYYAWGTYWLWTPKELWTTIVWFFYSLYLHARLVRKWKNSTRAVLSILGFVIVMFTYLGVGLLMKSSHQF